MANSVDPDQTAPRGAVCSWSTLFASILNSSVMLCIFFAADDIFRWVFFLGALRVKLVVCCNHDCTSVIFQEFCSVE